MARAVVLALGIATGPGGGALAQSDPAARTAAIEAAQALREAIGALDTAQSGRDQVAALGQAIGGYEAGLGTLRAALRQASVREAALLMRFEARRDRVAQVLGALSGLDGAPGPLLLAHPEGPLATVRAGMLMAEMTPALQAEVEALRLELRELADLRAVQGQAAELLQTGLDAAQLARTRLAQAIAARIELPQRPTDDPARLQAMIADADTIEAIAEGVMSLPDGPASDDPGFLVARGALALPVRGTVLRRAGEADAAGIVRPGLVIATEPQALVTAPWDATIRYRGPLLDYGNVMLLEPAAGYLLVLAGLGSVFGEIGEIVNRGAPLGLMGGEVPQTAEFAAELRKGAGVAGTETLYIEIRQGTEPQDPAPWFAETKE